MRNSLLISLAIAGLVICSVALSVVVTATATAEAQQATEVFQIGEAYKVFVFDARSSDACVIRVMQKDGNWLLVRNIPGVRVKCGLRWLVARDETEKAYLDGTGVWLNSDHLVSVAEY